MRNFMRYLRFSAGDFVLVWLSAWFTSIVGFNAFYLDAATARLPLSALVCALLVFVLFAAAYDRKHLAAGIVGYLVVSGILIGLCLTFSAGESPYDDVEGNFLYLGVVMVVVSAAAFLLTRRLATSACWFIACAFACSLIQAFYQRGEILFSILSVLVALALIVYRNFHMGILQADAAGGASPKANMLVSLGSVAVAVGAAVLVWVFIIAPLNPGVFKITLITDYRQLPIVEVKGVANQQPTLNYDLTSKNLVDGTRYTTDDFYKGVSDTILNAKSVLDSIAAGGQAQNGSGNDAGTQGTLNPNSTQQQYNAQSYTQDFPLGIIILIVIAAIAALVAFFVILRRHRRKKRLDRFLSQEPLQQLESLYLFLLGRLGRIGFACPEGMTLTEFSRASAKRMAPLDAETRVSFAKLTDTYVARTCERTAPTEDELVPFVAYYLSFWKAAHRYLGHVKYFFKSFRL
jgi:hypothetical protein